MMWNYQPRTQARKLPPASKLATQPQRKLITAQTASEVVNSEWDLSAELLKAIATVVVATGAVGTMAVASGRNSLGNLAGAGCGLVATGSIVDVLRKKRQWEYLALIERTNDRNTQEAICAALVERAIRYQDEGIIMGGEPIAALEPSTNQPVSFGEVEEFEPEYEPASQTAAQSFSPEPMAFSPPAQTRHTPEPVRQATLVQAPEFKRPAAVSSKAGNGEFTLDEIANFRCLVWVKGAKGSGKTSKVTHIEKCRHDLGHAVWRIDPMPPQADLHRRRGIALYGKQENWAEIEFAVSEFNKLAKERLERRGQDPNYSPETEQHVNLSMDEGAVLCQIDKGVLEEFWLHTVVRRIRQANMSVMIGTHGETKRFLGMTNDDCFTGLIDTLKEDAILVQGHTLDSRIPQPFADITYQGRTWRVDCSHVSPHEDVEFPPLTTPSAPQQQHPPTTPQEQLPEQQTMLALPPTRSRPTITDSQSEAACAMMLPSVKTFSHPEHPGMRITEPALLELIEDTARPYFRVIVRQGIKEGGAVTVRTIQTKTHHNRALMSSSGVPFDSKIIRMIMEFLAEAYPQSFEFDGQTLSIVDPALMKLEL